MAGLIRIGDTLRSVGHDRVKVVGKARRLRRFEGRIGQGEALRVRPIVGDVGLIQLAHRHVIPAVVAVVHQVELIHLAAVDRSNGIVPAMPHVAHAVGSMPKRNRAAV